METARDKALALLPSRDLRFYGMTRWSNLDALAEGEKIRTEQAESTIPVLEGIYRTALRQVSEAEAATILKGLRRCPPRAVTAGRGSA